MFQLHRQKPIVSSPSCWRRGSVVVGLLPQINISNQLRTPVGFSSQLVMTWSEVSRAANCPQRSSEQLAKVVSSAWVCQCHLPIQPEIATTPPSCLRLSLSHMVTGCRKLHLRIQTNLDPPARYGLNPKPHPSSPLILALRWQPQFKGSNFEFEFLSQLTTSPPSRRWLLVVEGNRWKELR